MLDQTAVLLIAHGSRRAEANADLVRVAERVRERSAYRAVEVAYLEIAEPTIPQGVSACVASGASEVRLLPYFLSAGNHVTEDLERFRRAAAEAHPGVRFVLCPPLGLHPLLIDVILARLTDVE